MLSETWKNILDDFRQPISYLIPAIVVTLFGIIIYKVWRKEKAKISIAVIFLFLYIIVLLQTAFFSREPGSRNGINLILLSTWGLTTVEHAYFIENIMMFVPFGVLMPMVWNRMRKVRCCVLIGCLFSCVIELSQLVTQRGYCQLDDVVTNTIGSLVGWLIWKTVVAPVLRKYYCR